MKASIALVLTAALAAVVLGRVASAAPERLPQSLQGTWRGNLSGLPIQVEIWDSAGQANATLTVHGQRENLELLGYKESGGIAYFFRPLDVACLCIYQDAGQTTLAYFERDTVRTVLLTR